MSGSKRILVAGLNPAWQKTLIFNRFTPYEVNRARSSAATASGKGINFLRAVKTWNACDGILVQFIGGETGKKIMEALDREKLAHISVNAGVTTRTCTTLISEEPSSMTELIEPSESIPPEAAKRLFDCAVRELEHCDALAICGTYPKGIADDFYAELIGEARKRGRFVLLDSFMNVEKALKKGVDLLKINRDELFALTGKQDTAESIRACMKQYPIKLLAITDGAKNAHLSDGEGIWSIQVPAVEKVVNPIGSGDTCSAVTLSELLCGTEPKEAFRLGLSAASANCLTELPAIFDKTQALDLYGKSAVSEIKK